MIEFKFELTNNIDRMAFRYNLIGLPMLEYRNQMIKERDRINEQNGKWPVVVNGPFGRIQSEKPNNDDIIVYCVKYFKDEEEAAIWKLTNL